MWFLPFTSPTDCPNIIIIPRWAALFCQGAKCKESSFRGFHLFFPTAMSLTPLLKESMWRFCQLPHIFIPIIHLKTEEIIGRWVHRLSGSVRVISELRLHLVSVLICTHSKSRLQWCSGHLVSVSTQTYVSQSTECLDSLFLEYDYTSRSLGEGLWESWPYSFVMTYWSPNLIETWPLLQSVGSGCEYWLRSRNWVGDLSFYWQGCPKPPDPLFLWLF